ncbi:MAG: hypothetical protein NMNS01_00250 [Nitrosomonas sp.]|nr:MAG: hypothetical protein NMNS01_00250 [Nitrosomonas sp.]
MMPLEKYIWESISDCDDSNSKFIQLLLMVVFRNYETNTPAKNISTVELDATTATINSIAAAVDE